MLVVLAAMAVASAASARVFWRRPAGSQVGETLKSLGGIEVYTAPVRINDGSGILRVFGFEDPHGHSAGEIRSALRLAGVPSPDADSMHLLEIGDSVTRLLVFRPGDTGTTLVVGIEQSRKAFLDSRRAPGRHRLAEIPPYPGSAPGFYAENQDTRMKLATLTSGAEAAQIAAFYHAELAGAGWHPVLPPEPPRAARLFLRRNALCLVMVSEAADRQARHIVLLHKTLESSTHP